MLPQGEGCGVQASVGLQKNSENLGRSSHMTQTEKKLTLRKWSGHIGLQPVVVCTDHQSLQSWHKGHVDTPSGPAARRARWHETIVKFDLSVV